MKKPISIALLLFVSGCSGYNLPESKSPGAQLYVEKCTQCHDPVEPDEHFYFQWERLITLIERKIHHQGEMAVDLSSQDRELLLDYMKTHAKEDPDEDQIISPDMLPR